MLVDVENEDTTRKKGGTFLHFSLQASSKVGNNLHTQ